MQVKILAIATLLSTIGLRIPAQAQIPPNILNQIQQNIKPGDFARINNLKPEDFTKIQQDITRNASQDFFKQGQNQLQKEVDVLLDITPESQQKILVIRNIPFFEDGFLVMRGNQIIKKNLP